MHILVVTQFFPPEMGAPAARFGDFARYWRAAGHRVTVLTAWPNAPRGRMQKKRQQRPWAVEDHAGVRVIRTPILALGDGTITRKAILYASFAASALLQGALRRLRPDVVIGTTPPPTVTYVSWLLARRFGVPHVMDVRDVWPEALLNADRLRASVATDALTRLNGLVLCRSAAIVTVSAGKRRRLVELGAPPGRLWLVANGVDLAGFDAASERHGAAARRVVERGGVPDDAKIILYAGVFNPPQGLDLILDVAAARQRAGRSSVHFLLVGDGSLRRHLAQRIAAEGLRLVHIGGPVPSTLIAPLYRLAWASLVILRPRTDTHTVPSKLYECMAAARPTLLSGAEGDAVTLAQAAQCGPVAAAGSAAALDECVEALLADPARAANYGRAGRAYVAAHNDRASLSDAYLSVLTEVTTP